MEIPSEVILGIPAGLTAAVAVLWRYSVKAHERCEARADKQDKKIDEIRDRYEGNMVTVVKENTASNNAVVEHLRKLRRDLDPHDQHDRDSTDRIEAIKP
jgi:hypothetical protein